MQPVSSIRRIAALASLAFAAAACGGSTATGTTTQNPDTGGVTPVITTSVAIQNVAFSPANIQVNGGAAVTFTNNDGIAHNVTFSSAAIGATPNFSTGTQTLTMPTAPGSYAFHCTIHAVMTGSVTVK